METMTALGLLFGPMIGSVLNSVFGYSIPFFIIAIFFLLSEIPIYTLMPSDSSI
jgi:MFS family permease